MVRRFNEPHLNSRRANRDADRSLTLLVGVIGIFRLHTATFSAALRSKEKARSQSCEPQRFGQPDRFYTQAPEFRESRRA